MGHHCCNKQKVKRGLWSPDEDQKLIQCITTHGHACWSAVPKLAGLQRCGKSCRLRWINYLRPDLKRGPFSVEEERIIIDVHRILGNRWSHIAKHLPGRTDNEVKNYWNSCIKKKLMAQGLDPNTHNLLPSHQRNVTDTNLCYANQFYQQPPSSGFSITLDTIPPHMMNTPMFEQQIPSHGWPTNYDENSQPFTGVSNPSSIPMPSSTIPSDQFGWLGDDSSFWFDDGNGMTQAAGTAEVMQEQQENMEPRFNECSNFGLEFMDMSSGTMLTDPSSSMGQFEWDP